MTSLVLQLQQAALNKNTAASDLLRLALVVARKLDVPDFEKWINNELQGYKDRADLPPYREVKGRCRAFNRYRGWEDVTFASAKTAETFSSTTIFESVGNIEALVGDPSPNQQLIMHFPSEIGNELMEQLGFGWTSPGIHVGNDKFSNILDIAKTTVLDWALRLEKAGVLGEGLTFSSDEQSRAKDATAPVAYHATHMTVVQSMHQSQIQQGSPGATQTFSVKAVDVEALLEFVNAARTIEAQLTEKDQAQAKADLATLEAQAAAPTPSPGIVMEAVASVRKILESAAGSLTATNLPLILQKAAALLS